MIQKSSPKRFLNCSDSPTTIRRLEEITGARLRLNYPPQTDISFGDVETLAQDTADAERRRLGLGDRPVLDLRDLLETEVGLRILCAPLPSKMAGMFAFVEGFGGIVAVNGKHPPERRRATLAHEYGHLIADRYKPRVDYVAPSKKGKPRSERFAEAFSMEFLMPVVSLRNRFREIRRYQGDFKVADICRLSHQYFVSVEAMTIRLERLGLIPTGTRDQLKTVDKTTVAFITPRTPKNTTVIDSRLLEESGFRVEKARRILGICRCDPDQTRFSSRYVSLAVRAYLIGEISEEQLAGFLRCDRIDAREIVETYSTSNEVSDDGEGLVASYDPQISVLSHGRK